MMRKRAMLEASRGALAVIMLPSAVFLLASQHMALLAVVLAVSLVMTVTEGT